MFFSEIPNFLNKKNKKSEIGGYFDFKIIKKLEPKVLIFWKISRDQNHPFALISKTKKKEKTQN